MQDTFRTLAAAAPALPGPGLSLAAGLLAVVALVRLRHSRVAYAVIALYVAVAMEAYPLLQAHAAQSLAEALGTQNQRQQQALQDAQQQAQAQLQQQMQQANAWNPHSSPLETARAAAALDASAAPLAQPAAPCTSKADGDTDGLTDCEEATLGTDPNAADTDGDGLSDQREVGGFCPGAQRWYSDPLKEEHDPGYDPDGASARAMFSAVPQYRRRRQPDLFDLDIDGDGVPNTLDQSPFLSSGQFSATNPLELT